MKKFLTIIALVGFVVLTFGAPSSWALTGVDNPAVFELDGNTQVNATVDWESTFSPTIPQTLQPIQDPAPQTIFTTGGSKDPNDVSQWKWKNGSVPDKDNITQAAAVALALPSGDTAVYFTAARFDNSGDAQMGFWFFQENVAPQPNGTFGGPNHVDGDLLLLVNFTGGGLVPAIQVFKWQGGVNGGPVLVNDPNLKTGECGVTNPGNLDVCAITNANASLAPSFWNYTPKGAHGGNISAPDLLRRRGQSQQNLPDGCAVFLELPRGDPLFLVHHGYVEGFHRGRVQSVQDLGDEDLRFRRGDP